MSFELSDEDKLFLGSLTRQGRNIFIAKLISPNDENFHLYSVLAEIFGIKEVTVRVHMQNNRKKIDEWESGWPIVIWNFRGKKVMAQDIIEFAKKKSLCLFNITDNKFDVADDKEKIRSVLAFFVNTKKRFFYKPLPTLQVFRGNNENIFIINEVQ